MATTDSVDAFSLLQNMAPMSYDSSRLIDVACISFSSVDGAHLAGLQATHRQTVLAQFAVQPDHSFAQHFQHLCLAMQQTAFSNINASGACQNDSL